MYNGILHVNTKINIIVMMKIKKKLSATKYVHKMSQKPYNEFPGKKCPQFQILRKAQRADLSERFGDPCGEWEISQGAVVSMY